MNWTSEYPTEPGFYWVKFDLDKNAEVAYLDPDMALHLIGNSLPQLRSLVAEWQGPIEPQESGPILPRFYRFPETACYDCYETDRRFVSWNLGEVDGKPLFGIICRDCWIKRLTPEQRKIYMV